MLLLFTCEEQSDDTALIGLLLFQYCVWLVWHTHISQVLLQWYFLTFVATWLHHQPQRWLVYTAAVIAAKIFVFGCLCVLHRYMSQCLSQ